MTQWLIGVLVLLLSWSGPAMEANADFWRSSLAAKGAQVEQYALRAADSGFYPVMVRGAKEPQFITYLERGDVWKFGTTKNPATRYSQSYLDSIGEHGVQYSTEFQGTLQEAVTLQNMKIQNFRLQTGQLPPGNKVVN